MTVINPFDFFLEPYAEKIPFQYEAWEQRELEPYLKTSPAGPTLQALLDSIDRKPTRVGGFPGRPQSALQQGIRYLIRTEPGVQTPEQTLELACGSCRDTGWLLVEMLRHLGLAARFVSGYLIQLKPDVKPLEGPPGPTEILPICTRGRKFTCPARAGLASIPLPACLRGKGIFPWRQLPNRARRRPSPDW